MQQNEADQHDQITILTNKIIDRIREVERYTQKPTGSQVKKLNTIEDPALKASNAIVIVLQLATEKLALKQLSDIKAFLVDVIQLLKYSEEIKERLREWRMYEETVLFHFFRTCYLSADLIKQIIDLLGEDMIEHKNLYGQICLSAIPDHYIFASTMETYFHKPQYYSLVKNHWLSLFPWDRVTVFLLFYRFKWIEQEKLALEEKIKADGSPPEHQILLWTLLADKFQHENDVAFITPVLKALLIISGSKRIIHRILRKFPQKFSLTSIMPDDDVRWPCTSSRDIDHNILLMCKRIPVHEITKELKRKIEYLHPDVKQYFLRNSKTPTWILEIFAKQLIPNTIDFFSVREAGDNAININDNASILHLEELPGDIILYFVRLLSYKQIIPLSLTNKRMHHLILKDEYVRNHYIKKYFTVTQMWPSELLPALKSRERKNRLFKHIKELENVRSVELGRNDLLLTGSYLRWFNGLDEGKCELYAQIQLEFSSNRTARLYKSARVYLISGIKIQILGTYDKQFYLDHEIKNDCLMKHSSYFQLKKNKMIGCGYWMDLTTNQIQSCPWTADLLTIQMSNDNAHTGYGIDSSCHVIKQFDVRAPSVTSSQSAVSVHDGVVQNFAVRDDGHTMFVAARHVSEWDTRALRAPVKMSSDLNLTYSEQYGHSRPAIDLTSMKMVGREQLWDLADFTWKFDRSVLRSHHVAINGEYCVYQHPQYYSSFTVCRVGFHHYYGKDYYYVP